MNNSAHQDNKSDNADNNKPSFWLLHALGWSVYVVIFSFDNLLFTASKDVNPIVILGLIVSALVAATLTLPLRYIYKKCWQLNPKLIIATISLCCLLVALIWTPTKTLTMWYIHDIHIEMVNTESLDDAEKLERKEKLEKRKNLDIYALMSGYSYSFFMIMVWSTLYFGINYHYRLVTQKQLHLEATRLSHSAQIKMLRYQINPHFLFNTLNAISTLVSIENKEKAKGMLVRLSTFLRFSLDNDPEKKIYLHEEIRALMLYLEIEKMRFEDRLSISLRVDQNAENTLVPSLILQPLIENSIKYAIAKVLSDGLIEIEAHLENNKLHITVSDNGPNVENNPQTKDEHRGVGLKNIEDRLSVLYPDNHTFSYGKNHPTGFKVEIWIPVETN